MKKKLVIISLVGLHLLAIFLLVYKQNIFIASSFEHQVLEKKYQKLIKEKQHLQTELCLLQDKNKIKEFAQQHLGMGKMKLQQIRRLPAYG